MLKWIKIFIKWVSRAQSKMISSPTQAHKIMSSNNKPQSSWTKSSTNPTSQFSILLTLKRRKGATSNKKYNRTKRKSISCSITLKSTRIYRTRTSRLPSLSFCKGRSKVSKTRISGSIEWSLFKWKTKSRDLRKSLTSCEEAERSCSPFIRGVLIYKKLKIANCNIRGYKKIGLSRKRLSIWLFIQ